MKVEDIVILLSKETKFEVQVSYDGALIFCSDYWNNTSRYKSEYWNSVKAREVEQISATNSNEVMLYVKNQGET